MTPEERRIYQQKWRAKNPDKVRDQEKAQKRRKAIEALVSVQKVNNRLYIAVDNTGREYILSDDE